MGFFSAIFNNDITDKEATCSEKRVKYIKELNEELRELNTATDAVENKIEEQEKLLMEEAAEIENLKSEALRNEAELLEQEAAILRKRANGCEPVESVVVEPCKEKTKVLPEPKAGENIELTSKDVTLSPSEPSAPVVEKPTGKKTTMAAAMTAAMQSGLNKQAQA